jgi:hypothetical protein
MTITGFTLNTTGALEDFESVNEGTLLADLYTTIGTYVVEPVYLEGHLILWVDEVGLYRKAVNWPLTRAARVLGYRANPLHGVGVFLSSPPDGADTIALTIRQAQIVKEATNGIRSALLP